MKRCKISKDTWNTEQQNMVSKVENIKNEAQREKVNKSQSVRDTWDTKL